MALTDRQIKAMQPEDKPRRYHDAGSVPGLYIEVSPSGGKWWRFRFSLNGKQRLMSLGVYPEVSLKEARLAALEARQAGPRCGRGLVRGQPWPVIPCGRWLENGLPGRKGVGRRRTPPRCARGWSGWYSRR